MGLFSHHEDAYNQVYQSNEQPHESSWTHELVGGAAAFAAMHEYEKYEQKEGKPVSHAKAKEVIAAIAGAEADKLFETKGLNFLDKEKAKRHAQQQAVSRYEQQYE